MCKVKSKFLQLMYLWSIGSTTAISQNSDRPQILENENQNFVYIRGCQARQIEITRSNADRIRREDLSSLISWKEKRHQTRTATYVTDMDCTKDYLILYYDNSLTTAESPHVEAPSTKMLGNVTGGTQLHDRHSELEGPIKVEELKLTI
jgi:hypothetical protein